MGLRERKTQVIEAAGGLVWRGPSHEGELAVIHRARYGDWTLPKGKLEPGEGWEEAAVREIREETGCEVRLAGFAGSIGYVVGERPKVVLYWHMHRLGECAFEPSEEVDQLLWLPARAVLEKLDYPTERVLLQNAIDRD